MVKHWINRLFILDNPTSFEIGLMLTQMSLDSEIMTPSTIIYCFSINGAPSFHKSQKIIFL